MVKDLNAGRGSDLELQRERLRGANSSMLERWVASLAGAL